MHIVEMTSLIAAIVAALLWLGAYLIDKDADRRDHTPEKRG